MSFSGHSSYIFNNRTYFPSGFSILQSEEKQTNYKDLVRRVRKTNDIPEGHTVTIHLLDRSVHTVRDLHDTAVCFNRRRNMDGLSRSGLAVPFDSYYANRSCCLHCGELKDSYKLPSVLVVERRIQEADASKWYFTVWHTSFEPEPSRSVDGSRKGALMVYYDCVRHPHGCTNRCKLREFVTIEYIL
jgi:hypothetical protein